MTATADVAGEKVGDARKRPAVSVHRGKAIAVSLRDLAITGAQFADRAVRESLYPAVAFGVGVLVGISSRFDDCRNQVDHALGKGQASRSDRQIN